MKQLGKSIRARLYNIASNKGINYQHLLIRFFHERLLYRISVSRYRDNFYLKGGVLLLGKNLKGAFKKLSVKNLSNLRPHPAVVFVGYSHPPLLERLRAIDEV